MAITVYSELQTAVTSRMNRTDLGTVVDDGIVACVGRLNRTLRHPNMVTVNTSFACSARLTNLPTGFLNLESAPILKYQNRRLELRFLAAPAGTWVDDGSSADHPHYYNIRGAQIELLPAPTASVLELTYYAALSQFSSANATDWLLTSYPDVYLYGSAFHTAILMMDQERANYYKPLFEESVQELGVSGKHSRYGPAMAMRIG